VVSATSGCTASGIVTRAGAGRLDIDLVPPPRCKGCDGACLWYRVPSNQCFTLATDLALPVGSAVTVTLPDRWVFLGAALVYGLPLAALLIGAALGNLVFASDGGAAASAALALVGALFATPRWRRRLETATVRRLTVSLR
jgi:positive regulator of sigma E activity